MITLGLSCYYHDAAACLVKDGKIIAAAQEERFTRIKHDNRFPENAISFCLSWAGIRASDVDEVVFYEKPVWKFERILHQHLDSFPKNAKIFRENIGSWIDYKLKIPYTLKKKMGYVGPVFYKPHHFSHAASAFFISPFKSSSIVTLDGVGEWATTTYGIGKGNTIEIQKEIHFPHSLGLLYSTITAYLGFEVNDAEYKVMGLSAYGNPQPFRKKMRELIELFSDGSYALNMNYFDFVWSDHMYSDRLEKLFGYPTRPKEAEVIQHYADIAASLQELLEESVFHILKSVYKIHKNPNLCLSGGVALNSVMNGKILSRTPFKKIFIPPDPGDGGAAIGCALTTKTTMTPYLGPSYSNEQIESALRFSNLTYEYIENRGGFLKKIAGFIINQKVIGWFQGRMEWGPRALGNRSIIAAATDNKMKDLINAKIKHRELFRPFAPVILDKDIKKYFDTDDYLSPSLDYMLMVYPFKKIGITNVPATVHVDKTGRLQVIRREANPLYYDLINAYNKKTGIPILLNTSFNVRGEPIVCTPQDAIACFLKTDIDYLVMGRYIVKKNT